MTIKLFRQNIKTMSNEELEQETNRLSEYIHKHHSKMGARNTMKLGHCWLETKKMGERQWYLAHTSSGEGISDTTSS